ncbi:MULTISPECIES: hypothetical protein [unclassified Marinovum]|uniref:hypothetical protein n=1 Tax=unclassified Marinovum TaxID=2647166 RepID=UPI003EDC6DC2
MSLRPIDPQPAPVPRMAPIVRALSAGLGVDDMVVLGISSIDEARAVIARLRACDGLAVFYKQHDRRGAWPW